MFRYPVEIISDIYLTKIGGFSYELERSEVGINIKALQLNTSIIPNETYVTLKLFGDVTPYFLKNRFIVIGIDENMDCYKFTPSGELVLPESLREDVKIGDEVLVNATEFFRIDGDYSKLIRCFIWSSENLERKN